MTANRQLLFNVDGVTMGGEIIHELREGTRSPGGYRFRDGTFLKIYKTFGNTASRFEFLIEIDILMRLISPGLPRGYKLLSSNDIGDKNINHAILMVFVNCDLTRTLVEQLNSMSALLSGYLTLAELINKRQDNDILIRYNLHKLYISNN